MGSKALTKVAVITRASSGVGPAAATALARMGWRVIAQGRDAARSDAAEAAIRAAAPEGEVHILRADLSSLADTPRLAKLIPGLTAEGADTLVWLATSDEGGRLGGELFHQRKPFPIGPQAMDDDAVERLWQESEALVARAQVAA